MPKLVGQDQTQYNELSAALKYVNAKFASMRIPISRTDPIKPDFTL